MASSSKIETEWKFDVDDSTPLPALNRIDGVASVGDPVRDSLEAVYFDTPDLALAAWGITLRRRAGGADAGWHVKIPLGPGRRTELQASLGQPDTVPDDLMDRVLAYTRGRPVEAVAKLSTNRTTYPLRGKDGGRLADFVDDRVRALASVPVQRELEWREWEVELVHEDEDILTAAEAELSRSGAAPGSHASKLAKVMGDSWPPERTAGRERPHAKGPAVTPIIVYLEAQLTALLTLDSQVRLGEEDSIHQMRAVCRRTRSVLRTYAGFFRRSPVRELDGELQWLAKALGRSRDTEVMHERLRRNLGEQPENLVIGPVEGSINELMSVKYDTAFAAAMAKLRSERYFRLLDKLQSFIDAPALTPLASAPARRTTAKLANKAAKRVRRRHRAAVHAAVGPSRDEALHRVRKAAKQLRFAVAAVGVLHGKRAVLLEEAAREVQTILGDHQDSALAREQLRKLGTSAGHGGRTGFTYGILYAAEQRAADASEKAYLRLGKRVLKTRLKP